MIKACSTWPVLSLVVGAATVPAAEEQEAAPIPGLHDRPIVEKDERSLLWAAEDAEGNVEWFDITGATIDPRRFQFGIGHDRVDRRARVRPGRRSASGRARHHAYPVRLMDLHEVGR